MKIDKAYIPLLFFSCVAIGIVIGGLLNFPTSTASLSKNDYKSKLNKLINFIDNEYVDDVQTDSIVDLTVTNILANLDPHSVYVPSSEQVAVAESMKGDFVGIGVNFYTYNDTIAVIKPIANGPAERAGILEGDRILYADNFKLFGKEIKNEILYSKLKGEKDSEVTLTIYRKSEKRRFKIKVRRDVIPIKSVDVAIMLNKNTGYIKINRFAETTGQEFRKALSNLKIEGVNSLIIDLRENGGGFMEMAVEVADELLKDKELIVFTKNKKGNIDKTFATQKGDFETGKVAILIDENSASASEILAGAIQDNDRGLVFGRRSFGKGLVQREMNFDDGSAVRLTIARYYTPSGRSIQKPYVKGDSEEYYQESEDRFESGELYEKDKIKIADSLKFKTKKGRTVYGGGGITPDIFVPLEVAHGEESLEYILQTGIVGQFVFEQLDKNRDQYKGMSFLHFLTKIDSDLYVNSFEKFLAKSGLEMSLTKNKALVSRYITAEFSRQLFGEDEYYQIVLKEDKMIKKVLEKQ
ncbi:S41 family peptidase [Flavobacterium aquatile]|uniref:Peptidase S41 n=1 Tax=Flavobacterium aquatile LMG 4008 = ATCC 11947 TaxID=1453498 RepID=A0A095V2R3_9FLAO|nr:S41 family peptidase [Flavobacterium aquatile]KGD69095.1 peptidase S41 [Flavobacterium aquatile LMG 4008 = ATCC 11947]OXA65806.1 peptidase S41 [Flavobacterium aquatile] [Flavobacterium aquatile LMG 4008 = ATCC 11947]GEC78047.1 peptidase S41 [Flavobacterium aquatile]